MADPTLVVRVAANLAEFKANLAEGVDQVETYKGALARASSAFDGSRIVQQASAAAAAIQSAGGVSALTAQELVKANAIFTDAAAKMELMGKGGTYAAQQFTALAAATKAAPAEGGGFFGWLDEIGHSFVARVAEGMLLRDAIRELIEFGKEAVLETARIEDLSKATGLSAEAIQRFTYVAKEFGVDTEQMARGVEQLTTKLANGDGNAINAVQKLGLSVKDLIASGPEQAFLTIAEAVGRVEDPMQRNGLAAELFGGKLGKILIPMLSDLRTKMEEVPKSAIISDENITKAHDAEVAWERLIVKAKTLTVEVALAVNGYKDWIVESARLTAEGDLFGRSLDEKRQKITTDIELHKAAMSAADLLSNRLKALREEAILPLTDAQKGAIAQLDSFGVSHKEIAQLVETSEIAVKGYTDSLKVQEKAVKALAEEEKKYDELLVHMDKETFTLAMEHEKQWAAERLERLKLTNAAVLAEFDAQTKLNAEWGLNAAGAIKLQSSALDELNIKLAALHASKLEGISQEKQEQVLMDEYTKQLYEEAVAQDAVAASTTKVAEATISATDKFNSFKNTLVLGITDIDKVNAALSSFYDQLAAQGNLGTPGDISQMTATHYTGPRIIGGIPTHKDGGPTVEGPAYLHDDEYVVPKNGALVMSGGGSQIVNHIYVTQPLGTPQAVAAAVSQALTDRQLGLGTRFPARV